MKFQTFLLVDKHHFAAADVYSFIFISVGDVFKFAFYFLSRPIKLSSDVLKIQLLQF